MKWGPFWIINLFFLVLAAPMTGLFLGSASFPAAMQGTSLKTAEIQKSLEGLETTIDAFGDQVLNMNLIASETEEQFKSQDQQLSQLQDASTGNRKFSDDLYEQKILKMLGPAIGTRLTERVEIKVFKLDELGYRGYIAKIKLFDPTAFNVVLAKDRLGAKETTSEAARRTGAVLAINGGGFYDDKQQGKTVPRLIGNTVIHGKLVEPFNGYPGNLFFAGINRKGEVIGTVPQTEHQLMQLKPYMGVSFLPVLLKNGEKLNIPKSWVTTKQPRTMIGRYANNDLIVIVIDGRQNDWSSGITLERLQDKLLALGVKDAYNLDGGGSTAMVFKGQLLNRPSDGKERPVINNIIIMP